jgi:hypothetical protein
MRLRLLPTTSLAEVSGSGSSAGEIVDKNFNPFLQGEHLVNPVVHRLQE